jgi:hypothetical protein
MAASAALPTARMKRCFLLMNVRSGDPSAHGELQLPAEANVNFQISLSSFRLGCCGRFQPIRVNGKRYRQINSAKREKLKEQTVAKCSSKTDALSIAVTPGREVLGSCAAMAVLEF